MLPKYFFRTSFVKIHLVDGHHNFSHNNGVEFAAVFLTYLAFHYNHMETFCVKSLKMAKCKTMDQIGKKTRKYLFLGYVLTRDGVTVFKVRGPTLWAPGQKWGAQPYIYYCPAKIMGGGQA